jgi:glyoxylase-like metal-dependent hydrolase (beta-lactamase superfamily II)
LLPNKKYQNMKIHTIEPGTFKLDGGATFGVVPKSMWQKVYPADENNLCMFALRNLLVVAGDKLILIDTGIGNKQEEKFYTHYHRSGHHSIVKALEEKGFTPDQVTDVLLTHLHFDHVGDAVKRETDGSLSPTFKNATYHASQRQWEWANHPNQRERASFLKDNFLPLQEAGVLNFVTDNMELFPGIEVRQYHGHTDGLMVPFIQYKRKNTGIYQRLISYGSTHTSFVGLWLRYPPIDLVRRAQQFFTGSLRKGVLPGVSA